MFDSPPLPCGELMTLTARKASAGRQSVTQRFRRNTRFTVFLLLAILASIGSQFSHAAITSYPAMATTRFGHTSTVLGNGTVLVTGGINANGYLTSAEIFTQTPTPTWTPAASMDTARRYHTATELPNGKILVTGGETAFGVLTASATIYDPKLGTWSAAGTMATPRARHAATALADGRVLVTGGGIAEQGLASAEIYDWQTNTWSSAGSFAGVRYFHTATMLYNGKVLLAGGGLFINGSVAALASASLYDPVANSWTALPNMITSRYQHGAVALGNGKLLMISGRNASSNTAAAEAFDPTTNTWGAAASMQQPRSAFAQLLLPDGRVMVSGGWSPSTADNTVGLVEVYEPRTNTWSSIGNADGRQLHTMNRLGNGDVLIAGGVDGNSNYKGAQRVGYAPTQAPSWSGVVNYLLPGWVGRYGAAVVVMPNGNVMNAAGFPGAADYFALSETGQVQTNSRFTPAYLPPLNFSYPTLTMLKDGRLLMSGAGAPGPLGCSELYPGFNGNTLAFQTRTVCMKASRYRNEAILLKNNKVFSIGGNTQSNSTLTEIYDPATNAWTATGPTLSLKYTASALLADGKVLVTGYSNTVGVYQAFTKIYDPYANTWTTVQNMNTAREMKYKLVTLANGKVLAAGGGSDNNYLTAELFDPDTLTWSSAGTMTSSYSDGTAMLLPNGDVMMVGGSIPNSGTLNVLTTIYRPATNDWVAGPSMVYDRLDSTFALMRNGKIIATDGGRPETRGNSEISSLNYNY